MENSILLTYLPTKFKMQFLPIQYWEWFGYVADATHILQSFHKQHKSIQAADQFTLAAEWTCVVYEMTARYIFYLCLCSIQVFLSMYLN